jgi:Spx/MgsR family transcriptional regulator
MTLYGIKHCDTVKKSRAWFAARGIDVAFHDLRTDGLHADLLRRWLAAVGEARLVNRGSTTWRALTPDQQAVRDGDALIALLLARPTLIRRPVVELADTVTVGFVPDAWAGLLEAGS